MRTGHVAVKMCIGTNGRKRSVREYTIIIEFSKEKTAIPESFRIIEHKKKIKKLK